MRVLKNTVAAVFALIAIICFGGVIVMGAEHHKPRYHWDN